MNNELTLAEIIKEAREKKGVSQREIARQTGIDNNTIAQIEKGTRKKPNALSLKKLANILELDLRKLMIIAGYNEQDIEMTINNQESFLLGVKEDKLDEMANQIAKIKNLIKSIKTSKKTHSDPTYKTMSKEDIKFFDEQSDELIKMCTEMLKIYEKREKIIKHIL